MVKNCCCIHPDVSQPLQISDHSPDMAAGAVLWIQTDPSHPWQVVLQEWGRLVLK